MSPGDYVLACFKCHYKRLSNKPKGNCPKCGKPLKNLGKSKE